MQTLHKTVSQHKQLPQLLALSVALKFSKCSTLRVSHATVSKDLKQECIFPQHLLIWFITCTTGRDTKEKKWKFVFLIIKWFNFLFLLHNIHVLLVLIADCSLQSSTNIPLSQRCYWTKLFFFLFSSHSNLFIIALSLSRQENQINIQQLWK